MLVAQDVFRSMIAKIKSANALAPGAGDIANSLLVRDGLPPEYPVEELIARGATGDLLGYILDFDGNLVDHPINRRVVGIDLADLDGIPNVIRAAGGAPKRNIIRAVLNRGCINTLVTDEPTAKSLVEE